MEGFAALESGKAPAGDWDRLTAWVLWGPETTIPHCSIHPEGKNRVDCLFPLLSTGPGTKWLWVVGG